MWVWGQQKVEKVGICKVGDIHLKATKYNEKKYLESESCREK